VREQGLHACTLGISPDAEGPLARPARAGETAAVHVAGWAELRTAVAGVDPGLERLRLAAIGSASMVLAVGVMAGVRAATGQPVTLLIFAAVLAMISNLAVNEPDLARRRVTTALMLAPAAAAVTAGTLLAPHRVVADVAFVAVTVAAVYVRRFGPRGFALGMAGFMPYFFTQFLQARPAELPWLLVAAATGLGATLLLRGYAFAEREDRTLVRLLRAFRAHVHGLVVATAGLLAVAGGPADRVDAALRDTRRRRARLNSTALLVVDRIDRLTADEDSAGSQVPAELDQQMLDIELATERLAISTRRLAEVGGPRGGDRDELLEGLRGLAAATATGTPHAMVPALLEEAVQAVAALTALTARTHGAGERTQRVAFAVHRLAHALAATGNPRDVAITTTGGAGAPVAQHGGVGTGAEQGHRAATGAVAARSAGLDDAHLGGSPTVGVDATVVDAPAPAATAPDASRPEPATAAATVPHDVQPGPAVGAGDPDPPEPDPPRTLRLTTRQALQAGVAVALSIVVGELVSPARWYWAAVAAFVVFAGTNSRGDLLSRGSQRTLGTVGGVAAGMALALVIGDRPVLAVAALVACLFLALYLLRVSQALMAFWITAVLALMYGLIGQFSLETLLLRIEETAIGSAMGMLAGFLVLPRRTRDAYAEARDDLVRALDAVVAAATDRLLGREPPNPPVELARDMDDGLGTLRARTAPLTGPWRRASNRYRDALHILVGLDHYARALARLSDDVRAPGWAPVLQPAVDRIRANLDGLGRGPGTLPDPAAHRTEPPVRSAEELVDAAEAWAARCADPRLRHDLLEAARLVRRIDQSVLALAGVPPVTPSASRR
jgi:Fusaric acid resistance protein-like